MHRAGWWMLCWLLVTPAMAQFDWSGYREYQHETGLLRFDAERPEALGQLLVWPEQQQVHHWLSMAGWWQRQGWDMVLLLPDGQQQHFDPSAEQVNEEQQQWLMTLTQRLAPSFEHPHDTPQLVLTQGSASLWFQHLVQTGALPSPDGLIVLDALPVTHAHQRMLAMSLARSAWPVLDVFTKQHPAALLNQELRRQSSSRHPGDYHAAFLHTPRHPERLITAWMIRHGWMPQPPGAPDFLKGGEQNETGISRSQNTGTGGQAAPAGL
ncbi:DUF3530 domain-containing protein [Oceanimonas baumannii]|uniref:DUF3530 domain-containing protein n=1 Tax=Oceanimonas baumannii TaxID=129578 RepID=UPI003A9026D2